MLLEHNIPVYNQLVDVMSANTCACVIMGTGVGKSYVTLEYLTQNNFNALIVSPRNSINNSWKKLCGSRVDTITYQKLSNIYKDIDYSFYDVIICDEVHHIGAPTWGKPIKFLIESGKRVIGLTESSVRYTDGGRDVADEFFHGNVVFGESVESAIEKQILNPVTYVGAMYNSDGLKKTIRGKIQSRLYAKLNLAINKTPTVQEILKKNMPAGNRKGIIFASTINDIKYAIDFVHSVYPDAKIRFVHSKQSDIINRKNLNWFKRIKNGYLCSVDMISEGVHIKGVNTLIMLRRTESPNLFNQQLGRCLDANSKEPAIVFDLVNNKNSIRNTKNGIRIKTNSIANVGVLNIAPSEQLIIKDYTKDIIAVLQEIQDSLDNKYTPEEINMLIEFYQRNPHGIGFKEFAAKNFPNHSFSSVRSKVHKLGLTNGLVGSYTEEEDEIIRKYYSKHGPEYVAKLLGNRSPGAVLQRASKLGVRYQYKVEWTDDRVAIVKKYYPIEGKKVLSRLPGVSFHSLIRFVNKNKIRSNTNPKKKVMCVETGKIYDSFYAASKDISGRYDKGSLIHAAIDKPDRTGFGLHWVSVDKKKRD